MTIVSKLVGKFAGRGVLGPNEGWLKYALYKLRFYWRDIQRGAWFEAFDRWWQIAKRDEARKIYVSLDDLQLGHEVQWADHDTKLRARAAESFAFLSGVKPTQPVTFIHDVPNSPLPIQAIAAIGEDGKHALRVLNGNGRVAAIQKAATLRGSSTQKIFVEVAFHCNRGDSVPVFHSLTAPTPKSDGVFAYYSEYVSALVPNRAVDAVSENLEALEDRDYPQGRTRPARTAAQ